MRNQFWYSTVYASVLGNLKLQNVHFRCSGTNLQHLCTLGKPEMWHGYWQNVNYLIFLKTNIWGHVSFMLGLLLTWPRYQAIPFPWLNWMHLEQPKSMEITYGRNYSNCTMRTHECVVLTCLFEKPLCILENVTTKFLLCQFSYAPVFRSSPFLCWFLWSLLLLFSFGFWPEAFILTESASST